MSEVIRGRLRTSVLGAALISAFVAGLLGGMVIAVGSGLGLGAGGLADMPFVMLMPWALAMGPVLSLPVGAFCGAAVAQHVRRSLLRGASVQSVSVRAAITGAILGALYGTGLYYVDPTGPSLMLLLVSGLNAGLIAGLTASRVVISDYRADALSGAA